MSLALFTPCLAGPAVPPTGGQDLFWVVGDSIGNGTNNRTGEAKPNPDGALREWNGTAAVPVNDTAGANDGTYFPAFALKYRELTGRGVTVCESALGGAEFYPYLNTSNWHETGTLYTPAKNNALAMLAQEGRPLRGIILILGINDARGTASLGNVQQGMLSLVDRLNADFDTPPVFLVNIGRSESGSNYGFPPRVRDVHKLLDNPDPGYVYETDGGLYGLGLAQRYANVQVAADLKPYRDLGLYGPDKLHLSQPGNDLLGETLATYIASNP